MSDADVLLEARGIVKCYRSKGTLRRRKETRALDGVDLTIRRGEIVALIGESGSGKTTLGKAILRLTTIDEGTVEFEGVDVFDLDRRALRAARRSFQMVFQNQAANLHPKMTVREMLDESIRLHVPGLDATGRNTQATELLERVGLTARANQRPGSLSGGERRRVGLARILATRPKFIVADEPTSGLDAAIKLQIIELLKSLKDDALTYLLISHDLGLVRRISRRVVVMLKGQVIEDIPVNRLANREVFHHPYTEKLMRASDLLDERRRHMRERRSLPKGFDLKVLVPVEEKKTGDGCVHAVDCQLATELGILGQCLGQRPAPVALGSGHWVACFGAPAGQESIA